MSTSWRPGKRVVIAGGGPGAISTALALISHGFDVRVYERQQECRPIGGAVLLSVPVLCVLRSYGIGVDNIGAFTVTHFYNSKGKERVELPFNENIEQNTGIPGWHYGVLRSSIYRKMLDQLPKDVIYTGHEFQSFTEKDGQVHVNFANGESIIADILVGADGIRSAVSRQVWGDPKLFHVGIRLYLAWCDQFDGIPANQGIIHHSSNVQASFFPMKHEGKPGFEWWVVEPSYEGKPVPKDVQGHVTKLLSEFAEPMPMFAEKTNFSTNVFRWEVYNRPSMKKWSKGRVVCLGDAVHPVSPYAAYGMGMAIEDGYYLARSLSQVDNLTDQQAVTAAFERFEAERVEYVNHNMEFARYIGYMFHSTPWPLTWIRDLILDYTPFLSVFLKRGYLENSEKETMNLTELFVR